MNADETNSTEPTGTDRHETNPTEPTGGTAPAVSVVVATRDRPVLLRRTLAAIAAQDHPGVIETVVVFDRSEIDHDIESDDPSRPVLTITNTRKPGLAGARNSGVETSHHGLVAFCDDDDTWDPAKLRRQVHHLDLHPDRGMVVGGIRVHFEGRTTLRRPEMDVIRFDDLLRSRILEAHPSSFLFRRELIETMGPVDEAIPGGYAEDYEYLLRAARHTDIGVVPDALVDILWHTASFFVEGWRTRIEALTYLLDRYPEFADEPRGLARIEGQIAFAHAASGNRGEARAWARRTLRHNRTEARALLSLLVSFRLVSADRVVRNVQRLGRGI